MKVRLKECLLSFLFGLMILLCVVGSTQAETQRPGSAAGPMANGLNPGLQHPTQPAGQFESLCGGGCVRDRTTGYIWESTPMPTPQSFSQAGNHCSSLNSVYPPSSLTNDANARARGWGVPFIWELATLPDPTLPSSSVPPNLFFNVQKSLYWAGGGDPGGVTQIFGRLFGAPFGGVGVVQPSVNLLVWCVVSPWTTGTVIIH